MKRNNSSSGCNGSSNGYFHTALFSSSSSYTGQRGVWGINRTRHFRCVIISHRNKYFHEVYKYVYRAFMMIETVTHSERCTALRMSSEKAHAVMLYYYNMPLWSSKNDVRGNHCISNLLYSRSCTLHNGKYKCSS